MTGITDHLGEIRARVERAAATARTANGVREAGPGPVLVAVSKGHPPAAVREAAEAGLLHFGENYLQEALPKIAAARRDLIWHFIGRLQSNKTRDIARHFAWVQTVTSARLAERLSSQRSPHGEPLQVCIQVQPVAGGEDREIRAGCAGQELPALADVIAGLPRLRLRGLMLLPHPGLDADALRMEYRAAREQFAALKARGHALDTLSMGMSDDFEAAIGEGSTMIRIGTALFGRRP